MKNIQTKWNLGLLYKSTKDPDIEKDVKMIERLCEGFEKKYRNSDFNTNKKTLLKSLDDFSDLIEKVDSGKPLWYFLLSKDIFSQNAEIVSNMTRLESRIVKASNKIVFFRLSLSKLDKKQQADILKDPNFTKYKYFLSLLFKEGKHKLSEKEEVLKNLLENTSYTTWVNGQEKLLNKQTVSHKGKNIPISEAVSLVRELPMRERFDLNKKINTVLKSIENFAEAEINSVYSYKKVLDELKGYKNPYSETVLSYENDEKSIEALVKIVTSNFGISHRFYKLHKKLLKQKVLNISDINVSIGKINKKFSFEESLSLVGDAFEKFDPLFKKMLYDFAYDGKIDVYPRVGKSGGAYCWGVSKEPTFILLNHTDNMDSAETLAHEMGHAIHTELAKSQPHLYILYSTSTAEVASTFFEQLFQEGIEEKLDKKEKIIFLHTKIRNDIATIFRQIACFNFENELHQKIRKEGFVESKDITKLMSAHLKSYLGDSVNVEDDDGYMYVRWSHIRRFFYVYSYAYGQIISKALFSRWKKDNKFKDNIITFLKSGRSDSPENIFKMIGIDTSKPKFFEDGLKLIEEDIKKLEGLTK